ncbi:MAG: serine/threonine protein kinase [Alphaproteobacteria bacterium]|nr:serine/threonine protein kinase [Alphaproteobacteria bacterium]
MSRRKRGLLDRKRSRARTGSDEHGHEDTEGSDDASESEEGPEPVAPPEPIASPITAPPPEPPLIQAMDLEAMEAPPTPTLPPQDVQPVPRMPLEPPPPAEQPEPEPPEQPEPVTHLDEGDVLGQWVVETSIGDSQGCALFRAHHKNTERIRVVLKVRLDAASAATPDLVHEGELLFALKHPNIASVRNLKLTNIPPYLEMDELPGERLDRLLRGGQIYMAQALDLIEQLLGALVYLHARGIVHRDIHPGNVMVRNNGVLTLMGFACSTKTDAVRPTGRSSLGYLAPEWPEVRDLNHIDLYATGCLLYELLTGRSPFGAPGDGSPLTVAAVLRKKRSVPFLDPGDRFHEDLRAIVRMLTSAEPRGRFPTAATALGRLQRVDRSYAT